jgi:hypothetical protein
MAMQHSEKAHTDLKAAGAGLAAASGAFQLTAAQHKVFDMVNSEVNESFKALKRVDDNAIFQAVGKQSMKSGYGFDDSMGLVEESKVNPIIAMRKLAETNPALAHCMSDQIEKIHKNVDILAGLSGMTADMVVKQKLEGFKMSDLMKTTYMEVKQTVAPAAPSTAKKLGM